MRFNNQRSFRIFNPSAFINKPTTVVEKTEFVAKNKFSDFPVVDQLKLNILNHGYTIPTPVQDEAILPILQGRDLVGIANTGTGKTAAFLIPLIHKVVTNRSQRVLIIAPTRELAVQIRDELIGFSAGLNIDSVLAIGGVSIGPQIQRLRRNPAFVIGTPGRLKDLNSHRALNFNWFGSIVLDEVDRMLDIGFVREIKYIISCLPPVRQALFFSATMPVSVLEIMQTILRNPVTVSVKTAETTANITQEVVKINGRPKIEILHQMLIDQKFTKVLVFGRTKFGVEKLAADLERRGHRVAAIHGNKNQNQRQRALTDFKNNQVQVMLATDIAARGLDINDISHVINYDLPESLENYIHRIGRTGRANKTGSAITFVD